MKLKGNEQNASTQQTVWRHAGCLLAESFAGI